MPEIVQNKQVFSLYEVARSIHRTLSERYSSSFWVKAEMNKLNFYHYSGHCYPELVEKDNGKIIAQMRANLWKDDYIRLNNLFLDVLREPLKDGIKLLFLAKVAFDPSHGLALRILDIDPAYTLGDLEVEKLRTIQELRAAGLFTQNKQVRLSVLPQRLAIISVETSKGYADFLNVLNNNPWGYAFFKMLFPAILQGERAVGDIIKQLSRIQSVKKYFDAVVIVRGGGSEIGLASFNHVALAHAIARCTLPVMTGIGHSTNETVAEMVAYHNAITPTKLAEFFLQQFHRTALPLQKNIEQLQPLTSKILRESKSRFLSSAAQLRHTTTNKLGCSAHQTEQLSGQLCHNSSLRLVEGKYRLHTTLQTIHLLGNSFCQISQKSLQPLQTSLRRNAQTITANTGDDLRVIGNKLISTVRLSLQEKQSEEKKLTLRVNTAWRELLKKAEQSVWQLERLTLWSDPKQLLQRGFSIVLKNGRLVSRATQVNPDDIIQTIFTDGTVLSQIKSIQINEEERSEIDH